MKAYQNGITKEQFVAEMRRHYEMDNFKSGTYGNGKGKACAIGCGIQSINAIEGIKHNSYGDHAFIARRLGVPEWLMVIEDRIFEEVDSKRRKTWPLEFAEALKEGSNTSKILVPMLVFIVESARKKTKSKEALSVIDDVLSELRAEKIDLTKMRKARAAAADVATYAAAAAAAYAAASASAYAAATYAACAAADADDAAQKDEFNKFADKLLELMRNCE